MAAWQTSTSSRVGANSTSRRFSTIAPSRRLPFQVRWRSSRLTVAATTSRDAVGHAVEPWTFQPFQISQTLKTRHRDVGRGGSRHGQSRRQSILARSLARLNGMPNKDHATNPTLKSSSRCRPHAKGFSQRWLASLLHSRCAHSSLTRVNRRGTFMPKKQSAS